MAVTVLGGGKGELCPGEIAHPKSLVRKP